MVHIRNLVAPKDLEDFDSMAGQFNGERNSEVSFLFRLYDDIKIMCGCTFIAADLN